jgi:hypothetical protein
MKAEPVALPGTTGALSLQTIRPQQRRVRVQNNVRNMRKDK